MKRLSRNKKSKAMMEEHLQDEEEEQEQLDDDYSKYSVEQLMQMLKKEKEIAKKKDAELKKEKRGREEAERDRDKFANQAGATAHSLWNSKYRLGQTAFDASRWLNKKSSTSCTQTDDFPDIDDVQDWGDFNVVCPIDDIMTTKPFDLKECVWKEFKMSLSNEAALVQSVITPVFSLTLRHGVQGWVYPDADMHLEYPVTEAKGLIPDGLIFEVNEMKPVLAIEAKHPVVYDPKHLSMRVQWLRGNRKGEKFLQSSPLKQIHCYMLVLKHRYGILTTYNKTWFLKREVNDGKGILYVSRAFFPDSTDPTLGQAFVYMNYLAFKDGTLEALPESAKKYITSVTTKTKMKQANKLIEERMNEKLAERSDRQENEGSLSSSGAALDDELPLESIDVQFQPIEAFGPLNHGVAYRMDVHGYDSVMKIVDVNKDHVGAEMFEKEVENYMALQELWGLAMPKLVGDGPISMGRRMITVTYEGKSLQQLIKEKGESDLQILKKDIAKKAEDALKAIHDRGYVHGDIAARNITYNSNGEVKIIDFSMAFKSTDQEDFSNEMDKLKQLFL